MYSKYNPYMPMLPGTVVLSTYTNFNGDVVKGLFVILYDEQSDNNVLSKKNVIGLKLSTKNTCVTNYSVELTPETDKFLKNECIVCCSKEHVLHKESQIYRVIGRLTPNTFRKIYKVYNKFNSELLRQIVDSI